MATLQISSYLEGLLNEQAAQSGCTPEQVAEDILLSSLVEPEPPLTEEQKARLLASLEQARRGEFVEGEVIERFLEAWQAELDAIR